MRGVCSSKDRVIISRNEKLAIHIPAFNDGQRNGQAARGIEGYATHTTPIIQTIHSQRARARKNEAAVCQRIKGRKRPQASVSLWASDMRGQSVSVLCNLCATIINCCSLSLRRSRWRKKGTGEKSQDLDRDNRRRRYNAHGEPEICEAYGFAALQDTGSLQVDIWQR